MNEYCETSRPRTGERAGFVLVFLLCLLGSSFANALEVDGNYHALNSEFEYLQDPGGTLTLDDLLSEPSKYPFTSSRNSKPEGSFKAIWLKLPLTFNQQALAKRYFLFGGVENFYDIRIYRPDEQGIYRDWVTGNDHPASSRELGALRYGFSITPESRPYTVYIRFVGGPGTSNLPWSLVEEETYHSNALLYYFLDVACLSGIGALLFFNLLIAISLKRLNYLYYSAYVFSVMMALITLDGIGFYYLWPNAPVLNERALHSFNLLSASMRLLAIVSFLGIAKMAPGWHIATKAVLALLAVTFVAVNIAGITSLPSYAATIPWGIGILFGFAICIYAIKLRIKLALPLLITLLIPGIAALLQGVLTVNSQNVGVLELQLAKIGFAIHVMLFSLCLAAQIKIQAESHRVALHDSLTGLPESTLLHEHFEWAANLSKRQKWSMAVLFVDLDGFKEVNDTLGHASGDQVLMQVAARMQGVLRQTDFVARMGGDEFVVLLLDSSDNFSVEPITERLLSSVAMPYHIARQETRISASIGIALYPGQGEDLPTLMAAADKAMYEAKSKGKNTYAISSIKPVSKPGNHGNLISAPGNADEPRDKQQAVAHGSQPVEESPSTAGS